MHAIQPNKLAQLLDRKYLKNSTRIDFPTNSTVIIENAVKAILHRGIRKSLMILNILQELKLIPKII